MKRIIFFVLIALQMAAANAQRHVIQVVQAEGKTERVEARQIRQMNFRGNADSIEAAMDFGADRQWDKAALDKISFTTLPPRLVHYTQSVETEQVHRYLTETVYDPDNYEYTEVLDYADRNYVLDQPNPMVIKMERGRKRGNEYALLSPDFSFSQTERCEFEGDSVVIWNATPGDTICYRIMEGDGKTIVQEGILNVTGQVRMIYAPSVNNFRDMGGWPVEGGGHMRYGILYRGAKFHDANNLYLSREDSIRLRKLGIKCEFDLRGGTEAGGGNTANYYSRLGRDIDYRINGHGMYAYYNAVAVYPEYFRYGWNMIKTHIFNADPIFVHCSHGCDRMGTWAMVIEGVLGVSENDLNHDYELSAFAPKSSLWRYRNMHLYTPDYDFRNTIGYIKSLPGETLRDKFEYFLVNKCKIPKSDIDRLREVMIVK